MAELADALDSGSSTGNRVEVQVLSSAPESKTCGYLPARYRRALDYRSAITSPDPIVEVEVKTLDDLQQ